MKEKKVLCFYITQNSIKIIIPLQNIVCCVTKKYGLRRYILVYSSNFNRSYIRQFLTSLPVRSFQRVGLYDILNIFRKLMTSAP